MLARTLFWLGGKLSRIKTPHRVYEFDFDSFVRGEKGPAERRWLPCGFSIRLLKWSSQLDWDHWDHWALVHDGCASTPCYECGGCVCGDDEEIHGGSIRNT